MKTQNLAILLTDIAGFTAATARQTREENAAWLARHSQLLRPVFEAFGGTVRKEMGDAFLCTFPSPTDAVLCGTAVLDRLWAYNQTAVPLMRLKVRVVVNMGEVRLDKGDILGAPVNVAARVEDVADGGDVTLTEAVFLTMNRSECELEPLGPHTLPQLPEPVTLYRVKQATARPPEGELHQSYPFGGTHLHRVATLELQQANRAAAVPEGSGARLALKAAGVTARNNMTLLSDAVDRLGGWPAVGRLLLVLCLLVAAGVGAKRGLDAWEKWQKDPFKVLADRVAAGDHRGASAAYDEAVKAKVRPEWRMDYYLGRISALEGDCDDVLSAYRSAVKAHEEVANDADLIRDTVLCVDGPDGAAARFVRKWVPRKDALAPLKTLANDRSRPAQARLGALTLLEEMGEGEAVPQTAVLLDILDGDHPCKHRREAVMRLSARKDRKSLEALRQQLKDSEADGKKAKANSCLVGPLAEAVRGIEAQ